MKHFKLITVFIGNGGDETAYVLSQLVLNSDVPYILDCLNGEHQNSMLITLFKHQLDTECGEIIQLVQATNLPVLFITEADELEFQPLIDNL